MTEPTLQIQRLIYQQELELWVNGRCVLQARHRVNKKVGNDNAGIETDLVKHEMAIEELQTMIKEVDALIAEEGKLPTLANGVVHH